MQAARSYAVPSSGFVGGTSFLNSASNLALVLVRFWNDIILISQLSNWDQGQSGGRPGRCTSLLSAVSLAIDALQMRWGEQLRIDRGL
jgi:hypothetical protein